MNENKGRRRGSVFMMMLTLTILACQGAAGFNPFATATPTPTLTFTPTPTFTVTPSPTATLTPTSTPQATGVLIEEQSDGRFLVTDPDNKFQFLLPLNWVVVFSTHQELQQAIQSAGADDPNLSQIAEIFKDVDPDIFRLAAINVDRKYINANFPTLLTMNAYTDATASTMPMAFVTAMIEDNLLKGATSTTWDVIDNVNKVEVGIVRGTLIIDTPAGTREKVDEMVIAFQANKKLIVIQIAASQKFADQVLAPFNDIIDSIKVDIQ